jgi:hypothetical protein
MPVDVIAAQISPYAVEVEAGLTYKVPLRTQQDAAVLR